MSFAQRGGVKHHFIRWNNCQYVLGKADPPTTKLLTKIPSEGKGVLFPGKYRVLLLCRRIREP